MGAVMVIVIAAYWAAEAAINASHQNDSQQNKNKNENEKEKEEENADETANGTDASESIGNNQTPCRHDAGDYSETDI
jgi:ribosomal protein L12E/L44/L45/RPP1/RPP2